MHETNFSEQYKKYAHESRSPGQLGHSMTMGLPLLPTKRSVQSNNFSIDNILNAQTTSNQQHMRRKVDNHFGGMETHAQSSYYGGMQPIFPMEMSHVGNQNAHVLHD